MIEVYKARDELNGQPTTDKAKCTVLYSKSNRRLWAYKEQDRQSVVTWFTVPLYIQ